MGLEVAFASFAPGPLAETPFHGPCALHSGVEPQRKRVLRTPQMGWVQVHRVCSHHGLMSNQFLPLLISVAKIR